jgi:hypothetical protein
MSRECLQTESLYVLTFGRHITIAKAIAITGFILGCATLNTGAKYCKLYRSQFAIKDSAHPSIVAMIVFSVGTASSSAGSQPHARKQKRRRRVLWQSSTAWPSHLSSGRRTCGPSRTSLDMSWPCRRALALVWLLRRGLGRCAFG